MAKLCKILKTMTFIALTVLSIIVSLCVYRCVLYRVISGIGNTFDLLIGVIAISLIAGLIKLTFFKLINQTRINKRLTSFDKWLYVIILTTVIAVATGTFTILQTINDQVATNFASNSELWKTICVISLVAYVVFVIVATIFTFDINWWDISRAIKSWRIKREFQKRKHKS